MATLPYVVTMDECVFCGEDSVQGDALCEDPRCRERVATCGDCGKTFPDIYPSARCPYEYEHEEDEDAAGDSEQFRDKLEGDLELFRW